MSGKSKGNHRPDFRCDAVRPTSGASGASLCTENLRQSIKRYAADRTVHHDPADICPECAIN